MAGEGIRARSGRKRFGQTPWGRRWVEVLERFHSPARLQRGRTYARGGHVLSLAIAENGVQARVRGSRSSPYRVTLSLPPLPRETLGVLREIADDPRFAPDLLQGKLPDGVEEELKRRKIALFPGSLRDFRSACSCPDWENPCKHIAAVYYLIAEEFDRDPLLLFALRGLPRGAVQEALAGGQGPGEAEPTALPEDAAAFWEGGLPPLPTASPAPTVDAAVLRLLGPFPFWPGPENLEEVLGPIYRGAARAAEDRLWGAGGEPGEE